MLLHDYLETEKVSQTDFARRLGVTQGMVWQWLKGVRRISAEKVIAIETATDGKVSRHEIRPDLYPLETDS
jgi:DNA-binding transcriptional regulator YdaS (Cro superfamily)